MNVALREDSRIGSEPSMDALMLQVQQRDLLAFVQLYSRILPAIKRKVVSEGWQASAADDIVQEVFLRVWENPDRFDGQRSARAYLLGISRNIMREQRKAGAKTILAADQCLPDPAIKDDPAAAMERAELAHTLAAARSELSNNQAAALQMVYDDGMPRHHAAIRLGCSEHAIHLRLQAALCRMRQLLSGRMRPAILAGGIIAFVRRGLADVNGSDARPRPTQWTAHWVAGISAMCLIMSAPLCPDHPSGYQPPEREAPPTVRLSLSGEAAPSPAEGVEWQAK